MATTASGREWLLDLAPRGQVALGDAASSAATVGDAVARVGERPVRWAVEVGRGMAATIIEEIPEFGGGDGPFETLRMGTESSTLRSLVLLAQPDAGLPAITEEALAGERDFVRRGISLDKLLRGIRFGHAGMARAFLDVPWSADAGLPRLPGCAGWMTGTVVQRLEAGDHVLLVVRVDTASSIPARPLVYARRTFGTHSGLAALDAAS